ncbi:MAG: CDP-alcohol phosphatidyltransferase family protein [Bacteroidales bacterium]|nr:CDP-alcohol phosphatidyltransferase family protein [Bacteroidales bacterium]
MLFSPVFSPWSWVLYCWGGISDMIDGALARKLNSANGTGAEIDSLAD